MLRERRRHANFKPNRRLDRKSSRGMIYENEELRLRTININAEVERGQSDIRKLRRENEQLRKEIWTLRDEYDKLDKLLRTKQRDSTGANNNNSDECDDSDGECCSHSDSDHEYCEECNYDGKDEDDTKSVQQNSTRKAHVNFDDLSIVSEEDVNGISSQANSPTPTIKNADPTADDDFTPEKAAASLMDFQNSVPPLAHFENLPYEKIGPNLEDLLQDGNYTSNTNGRSSSGNTADSYSTGETVVQKHGWDFNQRTRSPFVRRKSPIKSFQVEQQTPAPILTSQTGRGPDILFVSTAPSTTTQTTSITIKEPIYADVKKSIPLPPTPFNLVTPPIGFQTGGNLDDLLSEIEYFHNTSQPFRFPAIGNKSLSQDDLNYLNSSALSPTPSHKMEFSTFGKSGNSQRHQATDKPYRSEMNLLLSYDGTTPRIVPLDKKTDSDSSQKDDSKGSLHNVLETPPPQLPEPMSLLPKQLPYIGLEKYQQPINTKGIEKPVIPPPPPVRTTSTLTRANKLKLNHSKSLDLYNAPSRNPVTSTVTTTATSTVMSTTTESTNSKPESTKTKLQRRVSIFFNGASNSKSSSIADNDDTEEIKETDSHKEQSDHNHREHRHSSPKIQLRNRHQHKARKSSIDLNPLMHNGIDGFGKIGAIIPAKAPPKRRCSQQHSHHHHRRRQSTDTTNEGYNYSERNSNSAPSSSRESSTSRVSQRSSSQQKSSMRKISITSHNGGNGGNGKIPWCGCWGNGCI